MHLVDERDDVPVRTVDELRAYFAMAGKPAVQWRLGTEHELIGVVTAPGELGKAPPYDGRHGIGALFDKFAARNGSIVPWCGNGSICASVSSRRRIVCVGSSAITMPTVVISLVKKARPSSRKCRCRPRIGLSWISWWPNGKGTNDN